MSRRTCLDALAFIKSMSMRHERAVGSEERQPDCQRMRSWGPTTRIVGTGFSKLMTGETKEVNKFVRQKADPAATTREPLRD